MIDKDFERQRIGMRIAELRKKKGLTQVELGAMCGRQNSHIARIEKGKFSVGLDTLQAIAVALGCDIDFVPK